MTEEIEVKHIQSTETCHAVLDLETASTESDAAVVAIGATAFSLLPGEMPHEFYGHLNLEDCENKKLRIDEETIAWWKDQRVELRDEAFKGAEVSSITTLVDFTAWYSDLQKRYKTVRIWGNGANFDPVVIGNCLDAFDVKIPWQFRDVRCLRTLLKLLPKKYHIEQPEHTKHHAFWDARYEALNLKLCLEYLQKAGVDIDAL